MNVAPVLSPLGRTFVALVVVLAGVGCRTSHEYSAADPYYYDNRPEEIDKAYAKAIDDQGPNALLGVAKILSSAITQGDWERAEDLAVLASTQCNIHVGYNSGERDALSLLGQEKNKPFKGEPHEQVMVDFYLGLIRYQRDDYEGALAAFRSAIYKDRGSYLLPIASDENEVDESQAQRHLYEDDYALLRFMAAHCYHLLGEHEEAAHNLQLAKAIAPAIARLFEEAFYEENNVFVVVEGGRVPIKRKTGAQGSVLGYEALPGPKIYGIEIDGGGLSFSLVDDLYDQATTLGKRVVDDLNEEKAATQSAVHAAGVYTTFAGAILSQSHNNDVQIAGFAAMAAGVTAMIFASMIDSSADTRSWSLLPRHLYIGVGKARPTDSATLTVRARGPGGDESQRWTAVPVNDHANLYWIRLLPGKRGGIWPRPNSIQREPASHKHKPAPPRLNERESWVEDLHDATSND